MRTCYKLRSLICYYSIYMKSSILVILFVVILALLFAGGWFFRESIYWKLGKAGVYQPSDIAEYTIGNGIAEQHLTYIPIGDSLTAGVGVDTYLKSYPYLLAQKIAGDSTQVIIKPFAVPGVRSEYVLNNFIEEVIQKKPDIVTLFIGINDIHGNIKLQEFQNNYAKILSKLTQETDAQVYAINLPYIGTANLISIPYRYYFKWRTQQYNVVIEQLANLYGVTYIDLYTAHEPQALKNTYYSADFFHPNALGYSLWTQFIYANFRK